MSCCCSEPGALAGRQCFRRQNPGLTRKDHCACSLWVVLCPFSSQQGEQICPPSHMASIPFATTSLLWPFSARHVSLLHHLCFQCHGSTFEKHLPIRLAFLQLFQRHCRLCRLLCHVLASLGVSGSLELLFGPEDESSHSHLKLITEFD